MSDKELVVKQNTDVEIVTEDKINSYLEAFGIGGSLQPNERKQFTEIALAFNLNPFKREIYCVAYNSKFGRKLSIITGYEVYLKRASRLHDLNGWNCITTGEGENMRAVLTIHRKSWKEPFVHEVYLNEYHQHNQMWDSKTRTMIKKVCISQGFRMCFPEEFGGMPYTSDELPDEMTKPTDKPVVGAPLKPLKEAPQITEEAIVVEAKGKDKPEPTAYKEIEIDITGVSRDTKDGTFRVKFANGTAFTDKEVIAKIAKANMGKKAKMRYNYDTEMRMAIVDIIA